MVEHADGRPQTGKSTLVSPPSTEISPSQLSSLEREAELTSEISSLKQEIQALKSRLATSKPQTHELRWKTPGAFFDAYTKAARAEDGATLAELQMQLANLDPSWTAHFIAEFGKLHDGLDRNSALLLIMAGGGKDLTEFVLRKLSDTDSANPDRDNVLTALSGSGGWIFSIDRLPMTDTLRDQAIRLSRGLEEEERAGAAGILGGVKTDESRTILKELAIADAKPWVRQSAIRSLGNAGDATTLEWLREYRRSLERAGGNNDNATMRTLAAAIDHLESQNK